MKHETYCPDCGHREEAASAGAALSAANEHNILCAATRFRMRMQEERRAVRRPAASEEEAL